MKNALTRKYLGGDKKQIANGPSNEDIKTLANKKQIGNKIENKKGMR